jgi:hypothetical protein
MSNISALTTGVVAALGTVIGGFVVVVGSWLSTRRQRHIRLKTALRLLRNDFYADEHTVAYALKKKRWWPESLQLEPLAAPDDFAVVASAVDSKAWDNLAGARRHYKQLVAQRASDEALPDVHRLWTTFKLLEYGRRHLARYDKTHEFEPHSEYAEVRAIGLASDQDETRS